MLELYTFISDVTTSHCYELQFIFTFVSHLSRQIETGFVTEIIFRFGLQDSVPVYTVVNWVKVPDNELADVKQLLRIYSMQINFLIMKSIYVKLLKKPDKRIKII
jgi:hypothetical protein